ncbi:MAG: hypothetical protein ABJ327_16950, partial [Litoreibacter sp.]
GEAIERFEFADGSSFDQIVFDGDTYNDDGWLHVRGSGSTDDLIITSDIPGEKLYLIGDGGDDTLVAKHDGVSYNFLGGRAGSDTYVYHASAGDTWISTWGEDVSHVGTDVFRFADLNVDDIVFSTFAHASYGEVLEARFTDGGQEHSMRFANMGEAIERFEFADGSVVNNADDFIFG